VHLAAGWARNLSVLFGCFPDEYRKDIATDLAGKFNSHLAHSASSPLRSLGNAPGRSLTESCWQPWKMRCWRSIQPDEECLPLIPRSQLASRRFRNILACIVCPEFKGEVSHGNSFHNKESSCSTTAATCKRWPPRCLIPRPTPPRYPDVSQVCSSCFRRNTIVRFASSSSISSRRSVGSERTSNIRSCTAFNAASSLGLRRV